MDGVMVDFALSVARMSRLRAQRDCSRLRIEKKEAELRREVEKLLPLLHPVCASAIAEYNAGGGFIMLPQTMKVSIDPEKVVLLLFIRLNYRNGGEPDEDFGWHDHEERLIGEKFGEIMSRHLAAKAISLTFGGLLFPPSYFSR
jgi:hypothetical protein